MPPPHPEGMGWGVLRYPAGQSNVFKRKPFQSICESRYNIPTIFPCGAIAEKKQARMYIIQIQQPLHGLEPYSVKIICESRYNTPNVFLCGALAKQNSAVEIGNFWDYFLKNAPWRKMRMRTLCSPQAKTNLSPEKNNAISPKGYSLCKKVVTSLWRVHNFVLKTNEWTQRLATIAV